MKNSFNIKGKKIYWLFFVKAGVLAVMVFLLDMGIGSVLGKYYFEQKSGEQVPITNSMEKTTADGIIFGSSTARHDYDPKVFEKRLGISIYNAGLNGNSIFYDFAVLKSALKRYQPKLVILNFDIQEFKKEIVFYERLSNLLPYYKKHPEIDSIIAIKGPFEKYKLLSNIYPYNSLIFSIIFGNTRVTESTGNDGYAPLFDVWQKPMEDCDSSFLIYELDDVKIKIYESFIKECLKRNINIYVVSCPVLCSPNYITESTKIGKQIAQKYNVKFIDFSKDPLILNNHLLFADTNEHLNNEGAHIYSAKVADSILVELTKNSRF